MIKIIIDSTCDLDPKLIAQYNIDVVPLQVIINGTSYKDHFEMDIESLYHHIKNGDDIKTSLPAYDDIAPLFKKYAENNEPFIFFSFAKALSGTNNFANILVKELKENYKTDMAVIDLQNGGLASSMIIEKILETIDKGTTFNEIIDYSNDLANRMHHAIMLNDLTQLRKGGRISGIKSIISSVLSIRPILMLDHGQIKPYKNAIGPKRALNELVEFVNKFSPGKDSVIGILYSENKNLLNDAINQLEKSGYHNIRIGRIASVMTAHIGLDAVSFCFLS